MEKTYMTGELAKLCHITKRTVQYYDQENIIKPSQITEGGRRIYTEDDLRKFQLICLYKNLGLPLKEIKNIITSDHEYKTLIDLLTEHQKTIDNQINDLLELKNKVSIILDEINANKTISITTEEEFIKLCLKKDHHQKINKITYLLLMCYIIILFLSFIIGSQLGNIYMYVVIAINVLLLCGLIFIHSTNNAYICPHCHNRFTINFWKDLFSLHNGRKGKYLKCPYCHQKSWITETYTKE